MKIPYSLPIPQPHQLHNSEPRPTQSISVALICPATPRSNWKTYGHKHEGHLTSRDKSYHLPNTSTQMLPSLIFTKILQENIVRPHFKGKKTDSSWTSCPRWNSWARNRSKAKPTPGPGPSHQLYASGPGNYLRAFRPNFRIPPFSQLETIPTQLWKLWVPLA